jgi:hypothetical protein
MHLCVRCNLHRPLSTKVMLQNTDVVRDDQFSLRHFLDDPRTNLRFFRELQSFLEAADFTWITYDIYPDTLLGLPLGLKLMDHTRPQDRADSQRV